MTVFRLEAQHPVDCIVDAGEDIVLCTYNYCDGKREGSIEFINKKTKKIVSVFKTTGTLFAAYKNTQLYTANCDSVSIYDVNKIIKTVGMKAICTYVEVTQDIVVITDVAGCLTLFDLELNVIRSVKISDDSLWICKFIRGNLWIGSEEGWAYIYDLKNRTVMKFGEKRSGIINFHERDDKLYVASYDDNIEVFDINTLKFVETIKKTGSIWNIQERNNKLYCACMYDGLRVFNENWELVESFPTKSICYGLCIDEEYIYWSSFYESCVFYKRLQ